MVCDSDIRQGRIGDKELHKTYNFLFASFIFCMNNQTFIDNYNFKTNTY